MHVGQVQANKIDVESACSKLGHKIGVGDF
jgi:hypothetical protein